MSTDILKGSVSEIRKALPTLIAAFDKDIEEAKIHLAMFGKTAAECLREQPSWSSFYGQRKSEASKLCKFMEAQVYACRSKILRKYTDNMSRDLSERTKEKYIDNEQEYLDMYEIQLEIQEIKDKLDAICDAFDRRGFALRDWTSLRVHEMEGTIIR